MGWIKLRKKEIKDDVIYYYYQVELNGEWGILFVNTTTGQCGWEKLAGGETSDWDYMRQKGYLRILQYARDNNYPETDMIACG